MSCSSRLSSGCFVIFVNVDDPETFSMSSVEIFEKKYLLAYFIFCITKPEPTMTEQLVEFAKSARKILRPVYLIASDPSLQGYVQEGASNSKLRKFYDSNDNSLGEKGFSIFEDRPVNMEGEPLVGLVCGICVPEETPDGEPMTKDHIITTIYKLAKILNATLELQAVLAELSGDHFQDGVWDEWVNPLLDGSGTISTLLRPSPGFSSVTYFSSFKVFFHIGFLTALPKKATFKNLIRLAQPFTISVWLYTLTSFFAVFIAFVCVLHFESNISRQKRERWAWEDYSSQNWGKCFQMILHQEMVCMGPTTFFEFFGPLFLMDVHRKSLSLTSKQTMFPSLVYTGISRLQPNLVGTINFVFESLTSGGFDYRSAVMMRIDKEIEGQKFARSHMTKLKLYAGKSDDFNSNEQ
ncbi:unnamed protein product, partial [Allacma fusca]